MERLALMDTLDAMQSAIDELTCESEGELPNFVLKSMAELKPIYYCLCGRHRLYVLFLESLPTRIPEWHIAMLEFDDTGYVEFRELRRMLDHVLMGDVWDEVIERAKREECLLYVH